MIYTPLGWLFFCTGVAPSGTTWDKYICLCVLFVNVPLWVLCHTSFSAEDSIMNAMVMSSYATGFIGTIGLVVFNFLYGRSYQTMLSGLRVAEDELGRIDARPRPTAVNQRVILCTAVVLLMTLTGCQVLDDFPTLTVLYDHIAFVIFNTGLIQHLVLVGLLHSQFSALNIQLERFSATADDTAVHVLSYQLEAVFRIHTHLHAVVADLNGHFFIYNFAVITSKVIFCVYYMYNFLLSVSDKGVKVFPSENLGIAIQSLAFVVQCVFCHACAKEANRTVLLAHYTLQPHTPHRLWQEVGFFSSLCIDNKVHFTVGEVFTLDRPLITKVAVLALSYLIVAVQLKDVQLFGEEGPPPDTNVTAHYYFNNTSVENMTEYGS